MPEEWVSVREAARRLGISPETVRRRIEAGELVGEREALGGSRERFRVRFDAPETPQESPTDPSTDDASPALAEASAGVTRLLDAVLAQGERIADLSEELGRAEALLGAANARAEQYALDYAEQFERAVRAEARAERAEAELRRVNNRSWWRRLWHG